MNPERLREALREVPVPGGEEAEARGLAITLAAFEEREDSDSAAREPRRRRHRRHRRPRRLAAALVLAALATTLLLSPAGAAVRHWIGDAFTDGVPGADRELSGIPGRGRLLVQSRLGPWVVEPDGSRRLLGDYDAATWSPHGLYAAVAAGRTLTAVEPDGTPHWSLTAPGRVADPRWSASGYRIAYRSGRGLRVVAGDGSDDRPLASRVAPIPSSWTPLGLPVLAYVDGGGRLVVRATAGADRVLATAAALPGIRAVEWGSHGEEILETSRAAIRLRRVRSLKLGPGLALGSPRQLPDLPGRIREAALSPDGEAVAALVRHGTADSPRDEVALIDPRAGTVRRLFAAASSLGQIAFSPDGRRLLITWPRADQWLFVPVHGRGRVHAVAGISRAFSPGSPAAFPRLDGWCCRR